MGRGGLILLNGEGGRGILLNGEGGVVTVEFVLTF